MTQSFELITVLMGFIVGGNNGSALYLISVSKGRARYQVPVCYYREQTLRVGGHMLCDVDWAALALTCNIGCRHGAAVVLNCTMRWFCGCIDRLCNFCQYVNDLSYRKSLCLCAYPEAEGFSIEGTSCMHYRWTKWDLDVILEGLHSIAGREEGKKDRQRQRELRGRQTVDGDFNLNIG